MEQVELMETVLASVFSRLKTSFHPNCRFPRDGIDFDRTTAAEVSELIVSTPSLCSHHFQKYCSHQVKFSLDSVRLPGWWPGRAAPHLTLPKNPILGFDFIFFIWGIVWGGLCSQHFSMS